MGKNEKMHLDLTYVILWSYKDLTFPIYQSLSHFALEKSDKVLI